MDMPISLINTDTSCILFVTASLIYVGTLGFNPHNGYIYYIHETSVGDSSVVKLMSGFPGGFWGGGGGGGFQIDKEKFLVLCGVMAFYKKKISNN
jgi:hypothetical protein